MWVSQRPASVDKQILANCNARFLGGFTDKNDLDAISGMVGYQKELHRAGGEQLAGQVPKMLHATDAGAVSVRKWKTTKQEGEQVTTDSEWIYSDDSGELRRVRSVEHWVPECAHIGASGLEIEW